MATGSSWVASKAKLLRGGIQAREASARGPGRRAGGDAGQLGPRVELVVDVNRGELQCLDIDLPEVQRSSLSQFIQGMILAGARIGIERGPARTPRQKLGLPADILI
jgi:hypothetical protein